MRYSRFKSPLSTAPLKQPLAPVQFVATRVAQRHYVPAIATASSKTSGALEANVKAIKAAIFEELGAEMPADWLKSQPQRVATKPNAAGIRDRLIALKELMPLTTLTHLLAFAPGLAMNLDAPAVVSRLKALQEAMGCKSPEEAINAVKNSPMIMTYREEQLRKTVASLTEILAEYDRDAQYVQAMLRSRPGVLASSSALHAHKMALLADVAAAHGPWQLELSTLSPSKLGRWLHTGQRTLLRLKFLQELGEFPSQMSGVIRMPAAAWKKKVGAGRYEAWLAENGLLCAAAGGDDEDE